MSTDDRDAPISELILYRTEDAQTRIQVRLDGDSVWLTQAQLAELYQVTVRTVSEHLQNIYAEEELDPERTIRKLRIVQIEGAREVRRAVDHYHLSAILAVGYRVRSARGTQFRQWATAQLSGYLVKGFAIDDERLKRGPDDGYFEDLLGKIRDIRSSERMFWRKVLEIYATSVDYDPSAEASQRFFATVQNKMHWAAHGHTAAELIVRRADGERPNAGMTNWVGAAPRGTDATVAKSYLDADELEALNRIVTAYLEFAELQALNRRPMTMANWITKLDDFLRLGDRDVLTHAGKVSHDHAMEFAKAEFARYKQRKLTEPSAVERDFEEATRKLEVLEKERRKPVRRKPSGGA